jgi:hypothetical protein
MEPNSASNPTQVLEIVAGKNATLINGAGVVANNPRGASLQLDGVNEYANVPYSSTLNLGVNNFTLAAWIRTTATVGAIFDRRQFVSGPQGIEMNGYLLEITSGRTRLWLNGWPFHSSASFNDGQWHHVAVTVDRSSSTGLRFYLDGNPTADPAMNPLVTPAPLDNPVLLQIGGGFVGDLDESAIFNRALTPAEVALLASVMNYGPSTPGCAAPSTIRATSAARIGSSFTVSSNHGPANGMGWAMIGSVPVFEGTNYGLPEYPLFDVDILSLVSYPAFTTDACGNGSVPFAVPADPAFIGITVYAQTLWYTPGCFPNGPTGLELATSNALAITILP